MSALTLVVRRYDGQVGRARFLGTYSEACRRVAELRRHPACALAWVDQPETRWRPRTFPQAYVPYVATRPMEVMK
jgi:hypothetical protein